MIRRLYLGVRLVFICAAVFSAITVVASGQSVADGSQKDAVQQKETSDAKPSAQPTDISGNWLVSWEVRMGTNPGTLHLQQNGGRLTGTFKDLHGISSISGTIDEDRITFDVAFQGKYPFTIRFTGKAGSGKIVGSSQAVGVKDEAGAFLGHGGEIVHPDHPWTATRVTADPPRSAETNSAADPPAKK